MSSSPQVVVCQHGSRHRYAIPRMLNEAGMLSFFYTDSSRSSPLGRLGGRLGPLCGGRLSRLSNRRINGVPTDKVFSSDAAVWVELFQRVLMKPQSGLDLYLQRHQILSRQMKKRGVGDGDVVYSMFHENLDFVSWAKEVKGMKVAVDIFISPLTDKIMSEEFVAYPGWGTAPDPERMEKKSALWSKVVQLADVLLCPSEWVADGVRSVSPEAAHKIAVVPYGCSIDYGGRVNQPVTGRVLFAGRDGLRKGLHYLAQSASSLKQRFPQLDFRVAGNMPPSVTSDALCKDLNFLGSLSSEQMKDEYLSADFLVLPALSEGFAGVVAEAIGAGCPVIVTKESGSPVVHEREGLVVPSKDPEGLSAAIVRLAEDRMLRNRCSAACLEQIEFYSEMMWKKRLVEVIRGL